MFQEAFAQAPTGTLVNALYRTHLLLQDADQARTVLKRWIAANPDDMAARLQLGGDLLQSGAADASIEQYEAVLERNADNVIALNNLAVLHQRRGDPRALDLAERAYKLSADNPDIVDTYGWLLIQAGKHEQGLALLSKALELLPENSEVRYHYAAALAKTGDERQARQELEALLASSEFAQADEARKLLETLK